MVKVVKEHDMCEGSTADNWYRITVHNRNTGDIEEEFLERTMQEANRSFWNAGYRLS